MTTRAQTIGYWVATALGALALGGSGFGNLSKAPEVVAALSALGYPEYFPTILGVWKVLAAVAMLVPGVPRLKEWAYAGVFFAMTGAVASHVLAGDPATAGIAPLVILSVVAASYALRPADRRLVGPVV